MAMNNLMHWNDQKYKLEEQIRAEYPQIQKDFLSGRIPPDILEQLRSPAGPGRQAAADRALFQPAGG